MALRYSLAEKVTATLVESILNWQPTLRFRHHYHHMTAGKLHADCLETGVSSASCRVWD